MTGVLSIRIASGFTAAAGGRGIDAEAAAFLAVDAVLAALGAKPLKALISVSPQPAVFSNPVLNMTHSTIFKKKAKTR